jgi:U3 small nucleolar RNA-associated protein 14
VSQSALPGWGDWGGKGAPEKLVRAPKGRGAERKPTIAEKTGRRGLGGAKVDKEVGEKQRRDVGKKNVIVTERRDRKGAKYHAPGVPFGYSTREQYERDIRMPIGPDWNTGDTHRKMVATKFETKVSLCAAARTRCNRYGLSC